MTAIRNPRLFAFHCLREFLSGSIVTDSLGISLARSALSEPDRRLAHELVVSIIRRKLSLDYLIQWYSGRTLDQIDDNVRCILWIGFYQLLFMDKIPAFAAVDESVKLAKSICGKGASGFVNALLRNRLRKPGLAQEREHRLSEPHQIAYRYSHPLWLIDRWDKMFDRQTIRRLCTFNNTRAPLVVRVHTPAISVEDFMRNLENNNIPYEQSPYHRDCVRIDHTGAIDRLPGYAEGWFTVQDETPVRIVDMLNVRPGNRVLDLCAAPGGKTAYLSVKTGSSGRVVAVDHSDTRLALLRDTIDRLAIQNVSMVVADASDAASLRTAGIKPASFDRVMVDVPCSNTGVLRKRVEARWRLSCDDISRLAQLQYKILSAAAACVAPGGQLCYATCSIDTEENQRVIERFSIAHPSWNTVASEIFIPADMHSPDGGFGAVCSHTR